MTRRYVLLNTASGRVIARGTLRAMRHQRGFWTLMYSKACLPFTPDIRLELSLLPDRARHVGAV